MMHKLRPWLTDRGSFMQRLARHGIDARVRLLRQYWRLPTYTEMRQLNMTARRRNIVLIREVVITSGDKQWALGHSILPRRTLTGKERQLGHLHNRPLGRVLFHHRHMTRSALSFNLTPERLWARHCIFHLAGKPLLLTEIFLPDLVAFIEAHT